MVQFEEFYGIFRLIYSSGVDVYKQNIEEQNMKNIHNSKSLTKTKPLTLPIEATGCVETRR